ncbi:MAG: hypothetical protein LQ345_006331 [Seirophora villosa]|nr:MAG: hypothetical protein LQ345_006331 [Seirophora villosa]
MSKSNQGYVQTAALRKGDQSSEDGQLDEFTATVADKWQGTVADKHDMVMLGRSQVLRRNFSFISILGFSSVLICTWELIFANLLFALTDGGTGGLFWGFTVTIIAAIFIYLSIAEMASMSPTAGGQYHWVSEFAPAFCQKYLSYLSGWLLAMGWQGAVVSLSLLAGTIIQGQIALQNESYEPKQWHGTLLINAVVLFCIVFNTSLAKKLPLIEGFILLLHVIGLFAIVIPLWVLAPRNPANVALLHFNNGGEWQSTGLAFMVGLLTTLISMAGFDCSVHMSEEIKDASNTLPRALLWGVALNAVLGYVVVITLCFTITDPTALLNSTTGFPFIQLFYNVTNSRVGTHIMTTIIVVNIVSAVISEIATASRQIWSFARDDGFPFSNFLKKVSPGWNIPLNAVVVNFAFGVAISLINLGSSVALGAIVSLTLASLLSSYILSIGCMFLKRIRGEPLPPAALPLGRWGLAINGVALAFLTAFFIFCFFPTTRLVNASTMNWNSAMFGGITLFATIWYLVGGHKKYRPPVDIQNRKL